MKKSRITLIVFIVSLASLTAGAFFGALAPSRGLFYPYLGIFSDVLAIIEKEYVDPIPAADPLIEGAIKGLLSGLDQGSSYLNKKDVEDLTRRSREGNAESGFEFLKFYHFLLVTYVYDGSPGGKAGLQPGDQIIQINGRSVRNLGLMQCQQLLRGDPGEVLELSIMKIKTFKREKLRLFLEELDHPGFELSLKEGNVAYLKVISLQNIDAARIVKSLKAIEEECSFLLLDLRSSSSGGYDKAISFLSFFVSPGPLFTVEKKGSEDQILSFNSQTYLWAKPIYILIDSRTAGPSEAVAGILREKRQIPILGERSFGLGLDQELITLEDGTGIILSTKRYKTFQGSNWNKDGIKPDEVFEASFPLPEGKEDQMLKKSLEYIRNSQAVKKDKAA